MRRERIAIVGASLAGLRGAEALRGEGFDGRLALIGDEPHLPYDRPPLSKEILCGAWEVDRLGLRRGSYEDLDLELHLGDAAVSLDLADRTLALASGRSVAWDGLLIATGAVARPLPGALVRIDAPDPGGAEIYRLRTLEDAQGIRAALSRGGRIGVIGAGFIGAEVASSCRALGLDVTVVEPQEAPCLRGLGRTLGLALGDLHREHGVDLRCGTALRAIEGKTRAERLVLSDGSEVAVDAVVVGIGARPATDWLAHSGLEIDDGVVCDSTCEAAPGVVAAGDVARCWNPLFEQSMRVEHWTHAVEQSGAAARRLLACDAEAETFAPVPLFWSDQLGIKIQAAGICSDADELEILAGRPSDGRFCAGFFRGDRIVGAVAFAEPRRLVLLRRLIAKRGTRAEAREIAG